MRESGYKCTNKDCNNIIPVLNLDKHFGKMRQEMNCRQCGETFNPQRAEKLFSQDDLHTLFDKAFLRTDRQLKTLVKGTPEFKEVLGRRKEISLMVTKTGLEQRFYNEMGLQICQSCGNRNWIENKSCIYCSKVLSPEPEKNKAKQGAKDE